ncbi:MAG: PAS domain S-box protein [Planctomycetales bacterium]|nr:PAS domain S-box protein [Planctomycetales bacterium]
MVKDTSKSMPPDHWMIGAGALIALLALGIALSLHSTHRLSEDADVLAHTHVVMDALAELRGRLREAEAAQRTYLILGGPEIPPELQDNLSASADQLAVLGGLVKDNPSQFKRLPTLETHINEFADAVTHAAVVRHDEGFDAAREIVRRGKARRMMATISDEIRQMDNAERSLLTRRLNERNGSYVRALLVGALSGLAGIVGLIAFIYTQRRDLTNRLAAAAEIAEQRELMATIVESSNDPIISKSLDGTIQSWNAAARRLLGYQAKEIIGQSISLILPEGGQAEEAALIERLRRGERITQCETTRIHKDGKAIDVVLTISPIHNAAKEIVGASTIVRDVSERKAAEQAIRESEERFRTLADNMSQFAWMADPQGWVFWYNQRWYEYTGTTLEEMQGWGWRKVHHPDHVDRVVERLQWSWGTGEVWEDVFPLRSKSGEYRWFLSRALPIRDSQGNVTRWLGTNTDVTEQRETEQALKDADRRKDEFLAMLAHELRNPLAPIRNGLELLARDQTYDAAAITLMQQQAAQLVRLVEDLLDVSRFMRGTVELRLAPLDLVELAMQRAESAREMIRDRGQTLTLHVPEEPMWLTADAVRIGQVIDNLLNNASKYSDEGGAIELSVANRDERAVIEVRDDGMGIDVELLPRIFDLFTQSAQALDRSQGGLGIGLTVVQQLVELHGGRVRATSEGGGKGSIFTVDLPLAEQEACEAVDGDSQESDAIEPTVGFRVLVVDDNVSAAWMLTKLLEKLGPHQVEAVNDGPMAIERTLALKPDVVFLDIGLPAMDGYQVARDLRSRAECRDTYLIALTGYGQEEDRRRSREAGFDHHLVKPADISELEAVFERLAARTLNAE